MYRSNSNTNPGIKSLSSRINFITVALWIILTAHVQYQNRSGNTIENLEIVCKSILMTHVCHSGTTCAAGKLYTLAFYDYHKVQQHLVSR